MQTSTKIEAEPNPNRQKVYLLNYNEQNAKLKILRLYFRGTVTDADLCYSLLCSDSICFDLFKLMSSLVRRLCRPLSVDLGCFSLYKCWWMLSI